MIVASTAPERLSAIRIVSFVTAARDAVRVGLLTSDAAHVVDLTALGIADAFDAVSAVPMLRRTAGAILHGSAPGRLPVQDVHLVAPVPMARSVVRGPAGVAPVFADPGTFQGPGGHLGGDEARHAAVGLGVIVGALMAAAPAADAASVDAALAGTVLVVGWPQPGPGGERMLLPGAIGPYLAVPCRQPDTLHRTQVPPLLAGAPAVADVRHAVPAPTVADFVALARHARLTHTLQPGDLLVIFPDAAGADGPVPAGSWIRGSAPGLGTLSLAVR